jgi:hypothetical protein
MRHIMPHTMRKTIATTSVLLGALMQGLGCSGEPTVEPIAVDVGRPECEPLNPHACLAPWPSNRFLVEEADGVHVELPPEAMPKSKAGESVDPAPWNGWDGFSAMTSMVTVLGAPIDPSGLPSWTDPAAGLEPDSLTVVLDATTGERIAHFAELETNLDADPEHPTLYIRPLKRLPEQHSVVVAIRALVGPDGVALQPAEVFRVLRDQLPTSSEPIEARRASFESEVFGPLAAAGVSRDDLLEAWAFRTASGHHAWGDLLAMRDDALLGAEAGDFGCVAESVVEDPADPKIFRLVRGTFTVPLYLQSEDPGAVLNRGPDGEPSRNGTTSARFLAYVPRSVELAAQAGGGPFRTVVYGHGLFGSRDEALVDFLVDFAEEYQTVVFATDFIGLADPDLLTAADALGDLDRFTSVMDHVRQGLANQLVLLHAAKGDCAAIPELALGGTPLVDTTEVHYDGNSQGSILGITLAALSTDATQFALGVGGISYPIMMPRSVHWPTLELFLANAYPTRIDRDLLMVMFANQWDKVEGAAFAPHVVTDPLPGTSPKHVLFQVGLHDAQTPNVGSFIAARTMGLAQWSPSVLTLPDLPSFTTTSPSGLVVYDVGADPLLDGTKPPEADTVTHEAVRRDPRAKAQRDAFLKSSGVIQDFCGGLCSAP